VAFARRKRPDLKVVAFEPIPSNLAVAKRLCRILKIKDVEFVETALGDYTGAVEMVMPIVADIPASAQTYLARDNHDPISIHGVGGRRFTVPLTMLDCLDLPRVHGVKLDVENFEAHVLRGAIQLLKRDHPIVYCELWDTPNRQEVITSLSESGYTCQRLGQTDDFLFT
jgi:FkbM family methyltransferase